MKIDFTKEDTIKILYYSFCNYGLEELSSCMVDVNWSSKHNSNNYDNAKQRLIQNGKQSICREDVWIEILNNGDTIQFIDLDNDEKINLHIEDAMVNFNSLSNEDKIDLSKMLDEDDVTTDAYDCANALQFALYAEIIFG